MHWIDVKYIRRLSPYLVNFKEVRPNVFQCRCPYCGDSKKKKRTSRGYFLEGETQARFYCHNCGASPSLYQFLVDHQSGLSKEFLYEKFSKPKREKEKVESKPPASFATGVSKKIQARVASWKDFVIPILDLDECHPGRSYLEGRRIPEKHLADIFWTDDISKVIDTLPTYKDETSKNKSSAILTPFRNEDGVVEFLQARYLNSDQFRYQTLQVTGTGQKLWGRDKVDWSKRVWCLEAAFDAMCIDNAIAVGGASLTSFIKYLSEKAVEFTLVFDNELGANGEIFKQVKRAADEGCSIVVYDKTFPAKDINEAIKDHGWTKSDVQIYLEEHSFSGLSASLELSRIKKPNLRRQHEKTTKASGLTLQRT